MSVELIIISACPEEGFSWLFVSIDHAIVFQGELKENEIKETEIAFLKVYYWNFQIYLNSRDDAC